MNKAPVGGLTENQKKIIRFCELTFSKLSPVPVSQVRALVRTVLENGIKAWPLTNQEKNGPEYRQCLEQVIAANVRTK